MATIHDYPQHYDPQAGSDADPRPATRIRPRFRGGRCYELCGRIQMDDPTWTLVHGTVRSLTDEAENGRIGHAWLKRDGWVYDAVLNKSYPEAAYIERLQAHELGTWDRQAASIAILDAGHWGPW